MTTVLIVEDDTMIADCLEELLVAAGYKVCSIAHTVAEGIRMGLLYRPDLGVIDVRLSGGELGTEVATALCPRGGFGVLYVTGNPDHPCLDHAEGHGCLAKPYTTAALVTALRYVSHRMTNSSPASAPDGLRVLGGGPVLADRARHLDATVATAGS